MRYPPSVKEGTTYLISSFLEALQHGHRQKGSLYAASVIARLAKPVDQYDLRKKALKTLRQHVYKNEHGYWYIGEKNEKIYSIHDQLITLCSTIYSFHQHLSEYPYLHVLIDLLLPSIDYYLKRLSTDLQRTVGGEILLTSYLRKLIGIGILPESPEVIAVLKEYQVLVDKKVASETDAMMYYIEGFEESAHLKQLLRKTQPYIHNLNNIEVLAFLSNHKIPRAYQALYQELKKRDIYVIESFPYGEIFNIAWQYYILLNCGLLSSDKLTYIAELSMKYIEEANFNNNSGIAVSKRFLLKDADTTAMIFMLLRTLGKEVSLDIFSPYRQTYEDQEFFGSYQREVRPSMGTMAHILDALSFAQDNDPQFLVFVRILHNNLQNVIKEELRDSDKWHVSRWYFYANVLISYTHIVARKEVQADQGFYASLISTKEEIARRVIRVLAYNIPTLLTCEEIAWLMLGLRVYMVHENDPRKKDKVRDILLKQGLLLRKQFNQVYDGDSRNLEKMWIVKVAYMPLNIVHILIHSSLVLTHSLEYEVT